MSTCHSRESFKRVQYQPTPLNFFYFLDFLSLKENKKIDNDETSIAILRKNIWVLALGTGSSWVRLSPNPLSYQNS